MTKLPTLETTRLRLRAYCEADIAELLPLIGTREVMAMGSSVIHSSRRVTLRIGDPIPTEGLALRDRGQLTEAVREQIIAMLAKPSETSSTPGFQGARA